MAIQITGTLKNGFSTYENPQIQLIPHLTFKGKIAIDAHIVIVSMQADNVITPPNVEAPEPVMKEVSNQVGTIAYYPEVSALEYPTTPVNVYNDLIYALETYIINDLSVSNPNSTFTRI